MKDSYFINENQLEEWVTAAEDIKERFGIEKALGYVIGEKFYNLVKTCNSAEKMIMFIDKERKKPGYSPIRTTPGFKNSMNLKEQYAKARKEVVMLEEILDEFAGLISGSFASHKIKEYLYSDLRLGALGHICTEEDHEFLIQHEVVEHSIDTEIDDILILDEMKKYFNSFSS